MAMIGRRFAFGILAGQCQPGFMPPAARAPHPCMPAFARMNRF
jgi:hypothetical protein